MKKITAMLLSLTLCLSMLTGCGNQAGNTASSEEAAVELRVAALKGPTAMGMVKLMEDTQEQPVNGNSYQFTIAASADEVTPRLVQGEIDIAAVPANLASALYNNTKGAIQVLAINTLGVLYMVEAGESIQSVEDLRGGTIYASGKGATPEYALNYILSANGIDPERDVTIEWKSEHSECVAALTTAGEGSVALLPQPFVTTAQTKNNQIRIALDLTEEWDRLQQEEEAPSALLTGTVIVRKAFVEENPEAVKAKQEAIIQLIQQYEKEIIRLTKLLEEVTQEMEELRKRKRENR